MCVFVDLMCMRELCHCPQARVELPGVKGMWSLNSANGSTYLILSFISEASDVDCTCASVPDASTPLPCLCALTAPLGAMRCDALSIGGHAALATQQRLHPHDACSLETRLARP